MSKREVIRILAQSRKARTMAQTGKKGKGNGEGERSTSPGASRGRSGSRQPNPAGRPKRGTSPHGTTNAAVCIKWKNRKCHNGKDCTFWRPRTCKVWLQGRCDIGDDCATFHRIAERTASLAPKAKSSSQSQGNSNPPRSNQSSPRGNNKKKSSAAGIAIVVATVALSRQTTPCTLR